MSETTLRSRRSPNAEPVHWLSARSLALHLALVVWFPGCLFAFNWQVHRAFDGNALSYLYSIEWPAFSLAGAWAWWVLLHAAPAERRDTSSNATDEVLAPRTTTREDPDLAAYNEHLARLSAKDPSTWRKR